MSIIRMSKEPRPQGGALRSKFLNPKPGSRTWFGMTTRQEPNPYVMLNLFQHLVCFFLLSADASFIPVHSVSSRNDRTGFSGSISNKSKGVTLIELLIALVISAILVAGIYRTFIHQQKTYATQEQ